MSRHQRIEIHEENDSNLSYDVRVWKIQTYERKGGKTYGVRWAVASVRQHETFATFKLADSFRSKLISYQREGVAFDVARGLPVPMLKDTAGNRSWLDHMCRYIDEKWPTMAPKSRKSIADALATVTPALCKTGKQHDAAAVREVVYGWICVKPLRATGELPDHFAPTLRYLQQATVDMTRFNDRTNGPEITRAALAALACKLDGQPAAATTVARKRAVFYNVLEFGVEDGILSFNPIDRIKRRAKKQTMAIDNSAVVSLEQGLQLLEEVGKQGEMGQRLVAFFAVMLFGALRPAEALRVRESSLVELPEQGWGEMLLGRSLPRSGVAWSNTGRSREERSLKHRSEKETRPVPIHPELAKILSTHMETFPRGPNGELFIGPRGGMPDESTYLRIWDNARRAALTPAEYASPLAKRPYDLRHFTISFWLAAGIAVAQVSLWAGNSPAVIWAVYAKVVKGMDAAARRMVDDATARALTAKASM